MSTEEELKQLEDDTALAIAKMIADLCDMVDPLITIQPPTSVMLHAARAAAQVLLAFERGYRMSQ